MAKPTLLTRLEDLQHHFEEVELLITDPAVVADMKRFVKLNKEYRELEKIMTAKQTYERLLNNIEEAR